MENNFMNGFEQFKKRIDAIPDEQLIKECETLGMKFEQEIPKHHKNTSSNISMISKKSKHKHNYEECLIQCNSSIIKGHIITSLHSYCTICGKIGDRFKQDKSIVKDYRRIVDTPIGKCYSTIPSEELYDEYHDKMPVFFSENYLDRYVDLEKNNKMNGE